MNLTFHLSIRPFLACLLLLSFTFSTCTKKKDEDVAPVSLTAGPAIIDVEGTPGNTTFTIASNVKWTTASNQPWVTLSATSGALAGIITASYSLNPSVARTAIITITGERNSSATVTINQKAGTQLTPSVDGQALGADGGNFNIEVSSRQAWRLESNQSWLILNTTSGTGSSTISTTYRFNPDTAQRQATITAYATDNQILATLDIVQKKSNSDLLSQLTMANGWQPYRVESSIDIDTISPDTTQSPNDIFNCEKDDYEIYLANGTGAFYYGTQLCNTGGPSSLSFRWSYFPANRRLVNTFSDSSSSRAKVISLSPSRMVLLLLRNNGVPYAKFFYRRRL